MQLGVRPHRVTIVYRSRAITEGVGTKKLGLVFRQARKRITFCLGGVAKMMFFLWSKWWQVWSGGGSMMLGR
jgi:hypothetical protein